MTKTLRMIAVCASFGVAACTQSQDKCDAVADAGPSSTSEATLEVVNLTGGPLRLALGSAEPVSVANGDAFKVVEKATSGLKDTLKTNVRLIATDGGTSDATVETSVDIAADDFEVLVALSGPDGVVMKSGRQTQGTSFGEKVATGLQAGGNALAQGVDFTGDCLSDLGGELGRKARVVLADSADTVPECDDVRVFVRPALAPADSIPYPVVVDGTPQMAWLSASGVSPGQTSGRRTWRPHLFVTPPLPHVSVLNTARISMNVTTPKQTLARDVPPGALVPVSAKAVAQAIDDTTEASRVGGALPGASIVSAAVSFAAGNDTTTIPLVGGFGTGELLLIAAEQPGVLRAGAHAPARNRRELIFGSVVNPQATGCIGVAPTDDACTMGAAISAAGSGGGAASASYAATGRLLAPSNVNDATGAAPKLPFIYVEEGRRFDFSLPPTIVAPLASHGGFFVVANGAAVDARTLFCVDTSTRPWALTTVP